MASHGMNKQVVPYLHGKVHIMKALINKIENYQDFTIGVNDEHSSLALDIFNILDNSQTAFNQQCTIYFNELASAIINILRKDQAEEIQVPVESQKLLVLILRKLIENQNKTELEDKTMPIYEWEDDDWMKYYQKQVVDIQ
jgi:hypothetical protein